MATLESLNKLLCSAADSLDQATNEIRDVPLEPAKSNLQLIGEALVNILQIQQLIYEQAPELMPESDDEEDEPDPDLSDEELARMKMLSEEELERIDAAILSHAIDRWRKVAMIVGFTMMELENRTEGLSDVFYAQRVKKLVEKGRLEADGNLDYMRYSEVRLPSNDVEKT